MGKIRIYVRPEEEAVLKKGAECVGLSVEELMRASVLQYVADESDRQAYREYLGYRNHCNMLSFEEAKKLWK
ncbi:MAG: DUF6290 family protein [Aminobacteriaceae bacterium]|jgi:hypothetical protein|nr:DUF6290 family protein [Synergistaceae bacterium]MDD4021229.1 DUF6290 family protein [Synergistaceae bacterium]MDD4611860.1 DUF6290 family protein [Synergistaceae bacterium]